MWNVTWCHQKNSQIQCTFFSQSDSKMKANWYTAAPPRPRDLNTNIHIDIMVKPTGIELFHYVFIANTMMRQVVTRTTSKEDLSSKINACTEWGEPKCHLWMAFSLHFPSDIHPFRSLALPYSVIIMGLQGWINYINVFYCEHFSPFIDFFCYSALDRFNIIQGSTLSKATTERETLNPAL